MKKFYVYVFLREDRQTPYYVGKGCGRRWKSRGSRGFHLPSRDRINKIKENLTEEEAFALEKELIRFWGRKEDGGVLWNKTLGGEGSSGYVPTEETRELWSEMRQGEGNPFYGKHHTEETKKLISEKKKGINVVPKENRARLIGEKNGMFGRNHTEATKELIREKATGRSLTEESKRKVSENNPRTRKYIVTHPDGTEELVRGLYTWANERDLNPANLCHVVKGRSSHHKGYKVRYAD